MPTFLDWNLQIQSKRYLLKRILHTADPPILTHLIMKKNQRIFSLDLQEHSRCIHAKFVIAYFQTRMASCGANRGTHLKSLKMTLYLKQSNGDQTGYTDTWMGGFLDCSLTHAAIMMENYSQMEVAPGTLHFVLPLMLQRTKGKCKTYRQFSCRDMPTTSTTPTQNI